MIFRTIHNKENPYFQLNRGAVEDKRLTYKAIGIHTYLMSKPDHWEANESDIVNRHADGRSSVRSGIQELIKFGYMIRVQVREGRRIIGWRLDSYETPDLNPHYTNDNPKHTVTEFTGGNNSLESQKPIVDPLECDSLQVDYLQVENRIHSNKRVLVINEKEKETPALSLPSSSQNKQAAATEYMPGVPMPSYKLRGNKPDATVKARLPLVEKLIDIWAVRSLTDDADYDGSELGECHKVAAKLLSDGETAQSLDTHYKAYTADGWRNTPVSPSAFARYVAQSKATKSNSNGMVGGQITFKQWCLRTHNVDNPKFIGIPEQELRNSYEQSIRVH